MNESGLVEGLSSARCEAHHAGLLHQRAGPEAGPGPEYQRGAEPPLRPLKEALTFRCHRGQTGNTKNRPAN